MIDPDLSDPKHKRIQLFLLLLIIGVGAFVRFYGIDSQMPYLSHPDEPIYVEISRTIFQTGDLNPHFFKYPSLFFYIRTLAYIPFYYAGKLTGVFHAPQDLEGIINLTMGVSKAQTPSLIIFDRTITVLFGLGAIVLVFLLSSRMFKNKYFALIPALFLALFRSNLYLDKAIAPDTFLLFFLLLTSYFTLCLYENNTRKNYILAGLFAGLTISIKYNGGLILLPIIIAHILLDKKKFLKNINIYISLLMAGFGFVLTSPFALIDFNTFIKDFYFEMMHYSKIGHIGMEGNTLRYYSSYLYKYVGMIIISLASLQILKGIWNFSHKLIIFSSFPVFYFIMVSRIPVRNERTIFLIVPYILILAVGFISDMRYAKNIVLKKWAVYAGLLLLLVPFYHYANAAIYVSKNYYYSETHDQVRDWINANIPQGSKIALESYAPFVSPEKYNVLGVKQMIDKDLSWYRQQGYDYLIFSELMYSRFLENPNRYKAEYEKYRQFFIELEKVIFFEKRARSIKIYKVTSDPSPVN